MKKIFLIEDDYALAQAIKKQMDEEIKKRIH